MAFQLLAGAFPIICNGLSIGKPLHPKCGQDAGVSLGAVALPDRLLTVAAFATTKLRQPIVRILPPVLPERADEPRLLAAMAGRS
jgi:hypothetical protein